MSVLKYNIEAFLDHDLSYMYYNDFLKEIEDKSIMFSDRSLDAIIIFESSELMQANYFKKSHLSKMNKTQLLELAEKLDIIYTDYYNASDFSKAEFIEMLENVSNETYYTKLYENSSYRDFECTFTVRGYSQSDYCKVLLVSDKKNSEIKKYYTDDFLTNTLYDSVINVICTICDENDDIIDCLSLTDFLDDAYNFDKAKFIENVAKSKKYDDLLSSLEAQLSETID